jgi:hypothetical protein
MISLLDILDEVGSKVYQTYGLRWMGVNTLGQKRQFKNREDAARFAGGAIPGPHPGRAKPKQKAQKAEPKQKYDVTPVREEGLRDNKQPPRQDSNL